MSYCPDCAHLLMRVKELEAERDALREVEKAAKAIDYEMFNGMTPSVGSVNKLKNALAAVDAARGK